MPELSAFGRQQSLVEFAVGRDASWYVWIFLRLIDMQRPLGPDFLGFSARRAKHQPFVAQIWPVFHHKESLFNPSEKPSSCPSSNR